MYLVGFGYVFSSPQLALAFTGAFVIISQIKINVTNAYAGSIAWSNFFSPSPTAIRAAWCGSSSMSRSR
jgi:purine-cytosine permease-like protein